MPCLGAASQEGGPHPDPPGGVGEACGREVLHHRDIDELTSSRHGFQDGIQIPGPAVRAE